MYGIYANILYIAYMDTMGIYIYILFGTPTTWVCENSDNYIRNLACEHSHICFHGFAGKNNMTAERCECGQNYGTCKNKLLHLIDVIVTTISNKNDNSGFGTLQTLQTIKHHF